MRFLLLVILWPSGAIAAVTDICAEAAASAAQKHGVPYDLMMAVGRVESGRQTDLGFMPWPWTINQAGDGAFYDSEKDVETKAVSLVSAGKSNFDVGCFQVNYGWHGEHFASLETMIDPATNADYAATLLKQLYDEKGDWIKAAGAYHSGTEAEAKTYIAKVEAALGQPGSEPEFVAESSGGLTQAAVDWFLRDGSEATATLGSLVKLACSDCEGQP